MTDDERQMLRGLVKAVDHIFIGLSDGVGLHDWQHLSQEWDRQSEPLRRRLDAEQKARDEDQP